MITAEYRVENALGLHARVAARVVRECRKFKSAINVQKDGKGYDLKNVLGVIGCNAKHGDILKTEIAGEDEEQAAEGLRELFRNKFGE
jgi:phosphotransferase system HPr (HPr) family protein